jgi:CHASE3 domain sensor protein
MKKFEKLIIGSFLFYTLVMFVLIFMLYQTIQTSKEQSRLIREIQKEPIRMEIKTIR